MATGYFGPGVGGSAYEQNYAKSPAAAFEANVRAQTAQQVSNLGLNPTMTYDPRQPVGMRNIPTMPGSTPLADPAYINSATQNYVTSGKTLALSNLSKGLPPRTVGTATSGGSSGGARRGGGGGGAAAAPMLSQAQLDWMAQLLKAAQPGAEVANTLDLPDYKGYSYAPFDASMYDTLLNQFNSAVGMDRSTATQAYQNLTNWLNQNQTNAFTNGNTTYATADPTQQQAMARMLQAQGVNAGANPGYNAAVQGQAAGDAAFSNLWRVLAANEDTANRNRLGNVQQAGQDTQNALNVAALSGQTGIGLQRSQAQAAYNQAVQQMMREDWQQQQQVLQQEALANWQRANQVQDTNTTALNSYRNNELQSLLGLLPSLAGNPAGLPSMQDLGLA